MLQAELKPVTLVSTKYQYAKTMKVKSSTIAPTSNFIYLLIFVVVEKQKLKPAYIVLLVSAGLADFPVWRVPNR